MKNSLELSGGFVSFRLASVRFSSVQFSAVPFGLGLVAKKSGESDSDNAPLSKAQTAKKTKRIE